MELHAMSSFRDNLAQSESGGNYSAKNSAGFTGKYQFGPARLSDFMSSTGKKFSMSQFQNNPELQEEVQDWHEDDILTYVADQGLDKYIGQQVGGVVMSPESMLAMAHLGGKSGMKKFLETDGAYNPSDSNGTRLSDYAAKIPSGEGSSSKPVVPQVAEKDSGLMAAARKILSGGSAPRPKGLTPPGTFRRGGQMSPLSGGISTTLPNSDMIKRYSTPGGIGSLK
jgi:hypothetical protein